MNTSCICLFLLTFLFFSHLAVSQSNGLTFTFFIGTYSTDLFNSSNVTIRFSNDGKIIIEGGCNAQSSAYKANVNGSIYIDP
jgi:hypothetical protein